MKQNRPKVIVLNSATVDGRLAISAQRPLLYGEARWDKIEGHAGSVQPSLFAYLRWHYRPQANLEGSASFIPDGRSPDKLPSYKGDPRGLYRDYLPSLCGYPQNGGPIPQPPSGQKRYHNPDRALCRRV